MKKLLLLIYLGICLSVSHAKVAFRVGVGGGFNLAHIKEKNYTIFEKSTIAFNVAVPMEIIVLRNFSIQPEVHFIQKGFMMKYSGYGGIEKQWRRRNFIEFPILFKGRLPVGDKNSLSIFTGVGVGYALTNKYINKYSDGTRESEKIPFDTNIDDDNVAYNKVDVTLPIGFDYQIRIKENLGIYIDMRYNIDMTNNIKYKVKPSTVASYKYRDFLLTLGFSFYSKEKE